MKCKCGNEIGTLATNCPKCGTIFVGKTAAIVLIFFGAIVLLFVIMGAVFGS